MELGESISISRHGRAVAELVPAGDRDRVLRKQAMDRFMETRSTWTGTGMAKKDVLAARHEGIAFDRPGSSGYTLPASGIESPSVLSRGSGPDPSRFFF